MALKFSPNNDVRSRPYIFGLKDHYLIYLVLLAISGLTISGNASMADIPALPVVIFFLVLILIGYIYFRRIDKKHDNGYFDRLLSYHLCQPKKFKAKPIIDHKINQYED